MTLSHKLTFTLIAALLAGCKGDPLEEDVASYYSQITTVLDVNQKMGDQFLELTTGLKGQTVSSDDVAKRWEQQIVPQADELKTEVTAISPATAELQDLHTQLVFAWTERAEAYHLMLDAYKNNKPEVFQKAFDRNLKAKLAEEQYFTQVNALILPYGYKLAPYQ